MLAVDFEDEVALESWELGASQYEELMFLRSSIPFAQNPEDGTLTAEELASVVPGIPVYFAKFVLQTEEV